MATAHDLTTTFAGKLATPYISPAILMLNSISNGALTVKLNLNTKTVVKRGTIGAGLVQDDSCDFNDTSSINIDERIIDPKALKINLKDCKTNYLNDWESVNMGNSAWRTYPNDVKNWIIPQILAVGMGQLESNIWNGDKSNSGEIDGFFTLAAADTEIPAGQKVVLNPITAANVIEEVGKVVDATPTRLRLQPDWELCVAPNIAWAYIRALGGFGTQGLGANGIDGKGTMWYNGAPLTFDGIPMRLCNGIPNNKIWGTAVSNSWFATAIMSDLQTVRMVDRTPIDTSDNVYFTAKYFAAVQYGFGGDLVIGEVAP